MTALYIVIGILLIAVILIGCFVFSGCREDMYRVNYNGQKDSYSDAQDYYKAGDKVCLVFGFIATDTDYYFSLDGESINPRYEEGKGYLIEFIMPKHNVSLKWSSKNSMVYQPENDGAFKETMLVDYYRATVATVGGDGHRELVLYYYSDNEVKLSVFDKHEQEDEVRVDYIVPITALEECKRVIKRNEFDKWNDRYDNTGQEGSATVVKFRKDDGSYVRVSADSMPDDGLARMGEIRSVLESYVQEQYKVL